ncbi:MAG TPA: M20/M25/M40 family metallo-hydrolase [Candidatus Polarisedimenticolia bacterium]|nr:M20/M25/M40 family metallo-hydrolase [Candidatus Polarisedimenticolia bacterium]
MVRPTIAAAACCLLLAAASPAGRPEPLGPRSLASQPAVKAALAEADRRLESHVREWIRIAEIPAPSGGEQRRADYLEKRFREMGLDEVRRDAAGNVIGLLKGADPGLPKVALVAHMDTVAPATADHTVRREAGRLTGPGVRDDSSGLAGMVAAVELMKLHALTPPADLFLVASVREEVGLHGAESFVKDHAASLGAVVALDGHLGQVSYGATGIAWLKLVFTGEGAHTLRSHEKASAVLAAARAIERVAAIPLRRSPPTQETWLNVGMLGGGDVPNALPSSAWFVVDLRANDPAAFEELQRKVLDIGARTAREIGVGFEHETVHRMEGAGIAGFESSVLVRSARDVLGHLGWREVELTPRGSADHNVALARGIPGIAIGLTTGDGAHTPGEYADIEPFSTGVKQVLLLSLMPLTVKPDRSGQVNGS